MRKSTSRISGPSRTGGRTLTRRTSLIGKKGVASSSSSSSSISSSSSSSSSKSKAITGLKKPSPKNRTTSAPKSRGLTRRSSIAASSNNSKSHNSSTHNGKKHHGHSHSPTKSLAQGGSAGFGAGVKNKSYRELVKSEEEALQEVERLKEKLRSKHAQHQQDIAKAKDTRESLETEIQAATQKLEAEKENATSLTDIVESLKKKGTVLLQQLEAHGYDGIVGKTLDTVELSSETTDELSQVERDLAEAQDALAATATLQQQEGSFFTSTLQDIRVWMDEQA